MGIHFDTLVEITKQGSTWRQLSDGTNENEHPYTEWTNSKQDLNNK